MKHVTHEEFISAAENMDADAFTSISNNATEYIDTNEVSYMLRNLRTQITRTIRKCEQDTATVQDIIRLAHRLPITAACLSQAETAHEKRVEEARQNEKARRQSTRAWEDYQAMQRRREHYRKALERGDHHRLTWDAKAEYVGGAPAKVDRDHSEDASDV